MTALPTGPSRASAPTDADTFKFLLSTDNHLGFAERDPRRGDDSFTTFEEVLRAARVEHEVDALLLGGDLFHDNKPSLGCLTRACALFKTYVMGDRPVAMRLLSDPKCNFPTHAVPVANFQDPNVNIALPVFAIHGNHDDPVGGTSALDILAAGSYINYFGHVSSLEEIVVEPILLRKGGTFVALYGLGNVRDERLHRCFRMKKVHFVRPKPVEGRRWFNILIVHQNRGVRGRGARVHATEPSAAAAAAAATPHATTGTGGSKAGIYEDMLAGFGMDLVIWGNEHEQYMTPQPSHGFDIIQPGSTVFTSISPQECNPKQYGVLEVRGTSYRLTPFMLRSMRPVVRRTVELRRELPHGRTLDAVETFLRQVIEDMVDEAEEQLQRVPDEVLQFHPQLKYPLMRLAVDFTDADSAPYPQPNLQRLGQQYTDVVANPSDLLKPVKPKPLPPGRVLGTTTRHGKPGERLEDEEVLDMLSRAPQLNTLDIRMKMAQVFRQSAADASCALLSEPEMSAAVYAFAEKCERDAIDERLVELLNISQKHIWKQMENGNSDAVLRPDAVLEAARSYKQQLNRRCAQHMLSELSEKQQGHAKGDNENDDEEEEAEEGEEDEDGEGRTARRRRRHEAEQQQQRLSDQFERIAPPPSTTAVEGPPPVPQPHGPPPGPRRHGERPRRRPRSEGGGGGGGGACRTYRADGLHRSTIDRLVAEAVRENDAMTRCGRRRRTVDVDEAMRGA
ncbi:double-strand break repair protein MRE11 [Strigomonas culicis]|uniref:Double-strand break repair protein n=1 Tax=Strigomonas culicis TaxID=28005 RepID=S9V8H9_9TRYP|nr:double-strand break repair protein MRE11 [Strigomonas culicis]|eukprot:EPY23286.1 double-strand break repair protein MRE11 [Strigomonas culicis]